MAAIHINNKKKTIQRELQSILDNLREEVDCEMSAMRQSNLFADAHDIGEESQVEAEQSVCIADLSRHLQEIRECQDALRRLERGEYGLCIDCSEQIELNRLRANPVTARCISCQSKEENSSHRFKYASM